MYTWERSRKTELLAKIAKDKRGCWELWFGNSKRRKTIQPEMEKQTFGKQMFAELLKDNGTCSGPISRPCQEFFHLT